MMRAVFLAALATATAEPSPAPVADLAPATRAAVMAFVQDYKTNFADYETACKEVGATLHTALDAAGKFRHVLKTLTAHVSGTPNVGTKSGCPFYAGFFVHPDVSYRAKAPDSLEKKLLVSCGCAASVF
jgi:hypothetical protein